ncbi:hypothetical protein [Lacihabitans sp. CS3-21]|jgi:hypothetical protein|uniref:hypothetical protein n=1 Tax=Lacihabitans sp. CS3-21 TaxID=2487332 RepID=UPI0020CEA2B4|nr:hypothetical protein [Lacihabitans sp. CS3-21]MCP9748708.1 hypothetical protein [Lacihabitans sp. CS3-21]MDP1812972.1 hypothetical protein [Leadbetterella sp.]
MKKVLSLLSITVLMTSCGSKLVDPLAGCEKSAEKFTAATTAFFTDFTSKSKCEAFKSAASNYLKDCPSLTVAEVKEANDAIKDLNCNSL